MKAYPIDFVRQALEQTLLQEHIKNINLVGGTNQISIKSFYEQVQTHEQVNRYVETFNDLIDQANRTGLIGNGIITAPENPTITNINRGLVIPMTWNCVIRTTLADRDIMVDTINNLIMKLKGKKVDIAEFSNGELFMVGTMFNHGGVDFPCFMSGDYIGSGVWEGNLEDTIDTVNTLTGFGFYHPNTDLPKYFYVENTSGYLETLDENGDLVDDGTPNVLIAPQNKTFEKYRLSLSFDSIRTDEPKTLNGNEYVYISFSGSATLIKGGILGNDLSMISVKRPNLANPDYLEPLELGSNNSANTQISQVISNNFRPTTHTDSIQPVIQYSFLAENEGLLGLWFRYGRYGIVSTITPNMIYEIKEIWSYWGNWRIETFNAKIIGDIGVENTESDTLTLSVSFQIQGGTN